MRKSAGEDEVSDENIEIDRISELPDSILHRIFDFMRSRSAKDVARTTLLSKNWKRVFDSYQSFDFVQSWFQIRADDENFEEWRKSYQKRKNEELEKFKEYVENSLVTRLDRFESVDKLRLYADDVDMECVAGWIRAAMAKNVKELDVQVDTREKDYVWPVDFTQCSSITFLKIKCDSFCSLAAAMKMCNLTRISIKWAGFLDADVMKKLEENCPLLEDLRLIYCSQLLHLDISSLVKLRRVEVNECYRVERIEIAAPNLETFWFHANDYEKCIVDLKCTENLRNLIFKDNLMSDSDFEACISMCPLLEKLELYKCNKLDKLRICSQTLKSLALIKCSMLDHVEIDAPNLYSFRYEGRVMPFPFINAPRLAEMNFSFKSYDKGSNFERQNFFWNFDGTKGLYLIVYTKQNMKIFEEPRESDLYETTICKIELTASSSKVVKCVDNWLRDYHGQRLVVVSSNGEILESINTLLIDREDGPRCCKCWRNYIEDVKVSASDFLEKTSYDFTWRSRKTKTNSIKNLRCR